MPLKVFLEASPNRIILADVTGYCTGFFQMQPWKQFLKLKLYVAKRIFPAICHGGSDIC